MATIRVIHFSDVLCVWAFLSQVRIDELVSEFGSQVELEFRLFSVFGNARGKLEQQWQERGGMQAYSRHVREVAAQFDHVHVHPEIWTRNTPRSSLPAHLCLCAVRCAEAEGALPTGSFTRMAWAIRCAFFQDLQDVSRPAILRELMQANGLPVRDIESRIETGEAFAAMSGDMQISRDYAVRSSPTLIFNEDRQRLTGNVGYRIIEANVRELLEQPAAQHSWC